MEIKIKCPDCGKEIKIRLYIVEKLEAEILKLKAKIRDLESKNSINDLFGGIFK